MFQNYPHSTRPFPLTSLLLHSRTKPQMSDSGYDIPLCSSQPQNSGQPFLPHIPKAPLSPWCLQARGPSKKNSTSHFFCSGEDSEMLPSSLRISPFSLLGPSVPSPFWIFLALPLSLCPLPAWGGSQRVKMSCKCSS